MNSIFGLKVGNGEKIRTKYEVGQLACGSKVEIPVLILSGMTDGPTLWINGAVHGDELNGPIASWEFFNELDVNDIKGNIIITPISNPIAFQSRNKISNIDFLDMDTTFPGDATGLFTQRISKIIFSEIKENADYLISLHTMNSYNTANPYTVSKLVPNVDSEVNEKSIELAKKFGFTTNCLVDLKNSTSELPGVTNGALDITCMQNGIPAFMAEIGGGGILDKNHIISAKNGFMNIITHLKMIDGECVIPKKQYIITKRKFYRTDYAGIVDMSINPGDIVKKDTKIGEVHYFGDEVSDILIDTDAYIIGVRKNPVINTGDRVAFIGMEWHLIEN